MGHGRATPLRVSVNFTDQVVEVGDDAGVEGLAVGTFGGTEE